MPKPSTLVGRRWFVSGVVQGVGFRPWVFTQATSLQLAGYVKNMGSGVVVEVVGKPAALEALGRALREYAPPPAAVESIKESLLPPEILADYGNHPHFRIAPSTTADSDFAFPQISPDLAMCPECLAEIHDPGSRRYRYPFTTCARCGPRYTIYESPPFDRERTTMREFPLCPSCEAEYRDPADRRFHAQAMACPDCGPSLRWLDPCGNLLATKNAALDAASSALRDGKIVAVLGLGGFHLMVRADLADAVQRLRERKRRPWKPFAMLCRELREIESAVYIDAAERALLLSPEAPIVLLDRSGKPPFFPGVAEGAPCLGIMLAATPLHWLLLEAVGTPVVATSGNASESPVCIREPDAISHLSHFADFILSHDRPVARRCDDSILRVIAGRPTILRRARGFVPRSIPWLAKQPSLPQKNCVILGVGGHQKNALALLQGGTLLPGAHIGDLGSPAGRDAWRHDAEWLLDQAGKEGPVLLATDLHPDYGSTIEAERLPFPRFAVPHHAAHAFAALAESGFAKALAVVWDGTGLGLDGKIWGGEFFAVDTSGGCQRVAWLKPFPLPGGERAILEPVRSTIGALAAIPDRAHPLYARALAKLDDCGFTKPVRDFIFREASGDYTGQSCIQTTSAGRLFDALAALLGLVRGKVSDTQAPVLLENAARQFLLSGVKPTPDFAAIKIQEKADGFELDWTELFLACAAEASATAAAYRWHEALAAGIGATAERIGIRDVLLTGGCFQNKILTESAIRHLQQKGFQVFLPEKIPCNDGGLATGQCAYGYLAQFRGQES